ncbi:DNA polymerase III subunit delta [Pseudoflavonifractor sp. BIOML-A6]|nr:MULTISPECIES: DNA polymerase III subunit delta [unclassified Pseudoflavonifractor]MTQ97667.1 DNA polymerase III subunit delta [Pseudoflavonifractor sp. BIOML-A16]MTR07371.1 DNA polymerase III subunit delta [Pseudoflavonifractor sp. BIOML-A15]MTR33040.1 DNA polymerase III subunit delta [Pseudoflavonifractor sp. BIOML-A14]MTR74367.1 DNA polymerase III subunit delta [Pseudoflavonifractor sp. BIOML-A18]MTS65490.1 DNA polymerase III subunit delta [Pseudoflavonifractor sp. BIOML-A5]MTS72748.1 DN
MDLSQLAGNAALKRQLEAESARRGLSHAYILSGSAGSGRRTLARVLAAALVCDGAEPEARPCLACSGCRKVLAGIHPDVNYTGTDGRDITVAQVRALRSDAYIRPNEAARKVYVVINAQTMNPSAQNAMLKLLEEGPAYAAFLLLTDNAAALLQTVRSRCETLSLSPVTLLEAEDYLLRRFPDKPEAEVRAAAGRCEGLIGRAVEELSGAEADESRAREGAVTLLERFVGGDELSLMEYAVSLEKWDRDSISSLFGETVLLLRSALVLRAGGGCGETDPQRLCVAREAADKCSANMLLSAVDTLEKLRAATLYNAGAGHLAGWLCAALMSEK